LLGLPTATSDGREVAAACSFCVVQTEDAGNPFIYAAGRYVDRIAVTNDGLLFRSKLVVLDNSRVTTSMPIPI
jgi:anthranilate 1,2-dioxygenase small subunit